MDHRNGRRLIEILLINYNNFSIDNNSYQLAFLVLRVIFELYGWVHDAGTVYEI